MVSSPPLSWNLDGMVFDAWLTLEHNTTLTVTQHPVEKGAAITDHAYVNPRRWSFNIGETDTIATPSVPGNSSRSINAYQILTARQAARKLMTLVSKYGSFQNTLIESVDVQDNYQTQNAMRATINIVEVIMANTRTIKVSAIPHTTDRTVKGALPSQPVREDFAAAFRKLLGI